MDFGRGPVNLLSTVKTKPFENFGSAWWFAAQGSIRAIYVITCRRPRRRAFMNSSPASFVTHLNFAANYCFRKQTKLIIDLHCIIWLLRTIRCDKFLASKDCQTPAYVLKTLLLRRDV